MNARSQLITPQVLEVAQLGEPARRELYALFERYYESTDYGRFCADLSGKSHVLMLRDETDMLRGFSTLALYAREFEDRRLRVLFSGDTVVDEADWGQQALAFAWLRLAGGIHAREPGTPLYWLLISKGHRTYRYLSAFSRSYFPCAACATPARMSALLRFLARDRFGDAFDEAAGVLRFPESRGHLRARYAEVSTTHQRLKEVEYFLARNPGYARGDELVCLCELRPDNLRPMARRAFLAAGRP